MGACECNRTRFIDRDLYKDYSREQGNDQNGSTTELFKQYFNNNFINMQNLKKKVTILINLQEIAYICWPKTGFVCGPV